MSAMQWIKLEPLCWQLAWLLQEAEVPECLPPLSARTGAGASCSPVTRPAAPAAVAAQAAQLPVNVAATEQAREPSLQQVAMVEAAAMPVPQQPAAVQPHATQMKQQATSQQRQRGLTQAQMRQQEAWGGLTGVPLLPCMACMQAAASPHCRSRQTARVWLHPQTNNAAALWCRAHSGGDAAAAAAHAAAAAAAAARCPGGGTGLWGTCRSRWA